MRGHTSLRPMQSRSRRATSERVQSRGALRRELTAQLRRGHTTRRPQGCPLPQGRGQLKDKLMISERPAEADDRAVPGHWEGDLLLGKLPSAIVTLVERSSRFTQLIALPDGRKGPRPRRACRRHRDAA